MCFQQVNININCFDKNPYTNKEVVTDQNKYIKTLEHNGNKELNQKDNIKYINNNNQNLYYRDFLGYNGDDNSQISFSDDYSELYEINSLIKDEVFYEKLFAKEKKEKKIFEVVYPQKIYLFNLYKSNSNNFFDLIDSKISLFKCDLPKDRHITRIKRFYYRDNIRIKIKRAFLNSLIEKLNEIIIELGEKLFFVKFPQNFSSNIKKESNNKILNITMIQIFEDKDIYGDKNLSKYYHNLKVVNNLKNKKNLVLNTILNMKYSEIFENYINSEEFKVKEIGRLKKKNYQDDYIIKYIIIAKKFVEFFSTKNLE